MSRTRALLVVAMASEADALVTMADAAATDPVPGAELWTGKCGSLDVVIAKSDIGPVASAVATTAVLAKDRSFDVVVSTGIAGAFVGAGLDVGDVVVSTEIDNADLGKQTSTGYETSADLGWRDGRIVCDTNWVQRFGVAMAAPTGRILTVTRLSAEPGRVRELIASYPDAVAEAMEGAGVAVAAREHRLACVEVRAISNLVGPPEDFPWQPEAALDSLCDAFRRFGA